MEPKLPTSNGPPLPSPSLHTHSPEEIRSVISGILEDPRRQSGDWAGKVVVSHPPDPTALRATYHEPTDAEPLSTSCRPLSSIQPLDPTSLDRIPLSTPPRTPSPKALGKARAHDAGNGTEQDFPLIVVTGGSGFIGSHTVLEILQEGLYGVVVLDNLENSQVEVLHRVRILAAKHHTTRGLPLDQHPPLYFHSCDVQDKAGLSAVFDLYATSPTTSRIFSAIHFAALKSVAGSLSSPISYYQVNVGGTLNLVDVLAKWNCKKLVFSSSCVVYGSEADGEGILEEMCDVRLGASKGITNPYGRTKRMCEEILSDLSASDPEWLTMCLRYTNPSGAHPSGYIGEVFGADYDTPDGTGVRDFIHVVDLAKAHLAAIRLGTNKGTSVLTVIETLSMVAQRPIKMIICPRRPGDLGCVVCCCDKAEKELGWKAERGIVEMCRDLVNWQALNPQGYATSTTSKTEESRPSSTFQSKKERI
ncbi:hypothetical protein MNV49_003792 [Pseudohyphozyma bogoriensis]|nr:hypothetical protein MNV49_003792 [Pseudohyphozyma bogoriensis]